jgi:hypothetical protein
MATPHRGYDIHRSPVPITGTDGKETTGFEFTVTQNGKPIDIIVTATLAERRVGLKEVKKAIDRRISSEVAPGAVAFATA